MKERGSKLARQIIAEYNKEKQYKEWKERQKGDNYANNESETVAISMEKQEKYINKGDCCNLRRNKNGNSK